MPKFDRLPVWTGRLLADTTHLSTAEFGAYLLLLIAAWRSPGCRLPNDDELLRRITRTGPKGWPRMRAILATFFHVSEHHWQNSSLSQEMHAEILLQEGRSRGGMVKSLRNKARALAQADLSTPSSTPPARARPMLKGQDIPTEYLTSFGPQWVPPPAAQQVVDLDLLGSKPHDPPPPPTPIGAPSHARPPARKRGTRIDPDWRPDPALRQFAIDRGIDPDRTAETFRDFWLARTGETASKLDWAAAFRVWCNREADDRGSRPGRAAAKAADGGPSHAGRRGTSSDAEIILGVSQRLARPPDNDE